MAGSGAAVVVVVVEGDVVTVVVDVGVGGGGLVVDVGRVVGVRMTTLGGGRVGTVVLSGRPVVVVAARVVVVVDETLVEGPVDGPGALTWGVLPPPDEKANHALAPAIRKATAPRITTRRSISGVAVRSWTEGL